MDLRIDDPQSGAAVGLLTLLATTIGALFRRIHTRVDRLEQRIEKVHGVLQSAVDGGDDKLWVSLAEMRRDEGAFRERLLREMASKSDISELRASVERLASDLTHRRIGDD